jgi:hypothetical protein
VLLPVRFQVSLWGSAVGAAVVALAADFLYAHAAAGHRLALHPVTVVIVVAGVYGIAYFANTALLGIPEARRTLSRFRLA